MDHERVWGVFSRAVDVKNILKRGIFPCWSHILCGNECRDRGFRTVLHSFFLSLSMVITYCPIIIASTQSGQIWMTMSTRNANVIPILIFSTVGGSNIWRHTQTFQLSLCYPNAKFYFTSYIPSCIYNNF